MKSKDNERRPNPRCEKILNWLDGWSIEILLIFVFISGYLIQAFARNNFNLWVFLFVMILAVSTAYQHRILEKTKNSKLVLWAFVILIVTYIPFGVDTFRSFDFKKSFPQHFGSAYLNLFCESNFYSIQLAFLTAGYIDFWYSKGIKVKRVNQRTFVLFVVIILSAFLPGACIPEEELTKEIKLNTAIGYLLIQITISYFLMTYMMYLKNESDK